MQFGKEIWKYHPPSALGKPMPIERNAHVEKNKEKQTNRKKKKTLAPPRVTGRKLACLPPGSGRRWNITDLDIQSENPTFK